MASIQQELSVLKGVTEKEMKQKYAKIRKLENELEATKVLALFATQKEAD